MSEVVYLKKEDLQRIFRDFTRWLTRNIIQTLAYSKIIDAFRLQVSKCFSHLLMCIEVKLRVLYGENKLVLNVRVFDSKFRDRDLIDYELEIHDILDVVDEYRNFDSTRVRVRYSCNVSRFVMLNPYLEGIVVPIVKNYIYTILDQVRVVDQILHNAILGL